MAQHSGNYISPSMLPQPPSKLSPHPRVDLYNVLASAPNQQLPVIGPSTTVNPSAQPGQQSTTSESRRENQGSSLPKRGYRACVSVHDESDWPKTGMAVSATLKLQTMLTTGRQTAAFAKLAAIVRYHSHETYVADNRVVGDVNTPFQPPCSRCRREQRDCIFLPSKRRRRASATNPASGEGSSNTLQPEIYPVHSKQLAQNPSGPQLSETSFTQASAIAGPSNQSAYHPMTMSNVYEHKASTAYLSQAIPWPETVQTAQSLISNIPTLDTYSAMHSVSQHHNDTTTPASMGDSSTASNTALSPNNRSKRRKTGTDGRKLVNASVNNEMEALEILANAATDGEGGKEEGSNKQISGDLKKVSWDDDETEKAPARDASAFHLIKLGILDETGLHELVDVYFRHYHPTLPIFQTARIPRSREQLLDLIYDDSFLLMCIIAVASRHPTNDRYKDVHDKTWAILRDAMSDYSFAGLPGSVGFVEGVLLLAEHLPRERATPPKDTSVSMLSGPGTQYVGTGMHGTDNRRSWALIGLAIRAAYLLGLDQISLEVDEACRTPDVERARSVWTWCYLYDRTIDELTLPLRLRTGLAFWSRGPALCFVGYSHISQTGEAAARLNFPLQLSQSTELNGAAHNDSASLMQSLVELTQIMTNAHDILYPSKLRTETLVKQGEYFLFLDHFRRALDSYQSIWKPKKWSNITLEDLSWMTYHFVRLYISSFGYSAHVKRAQWRADEESLSGRDGSRQVQLFPRGSATSPDALYIYDSIGAANEVLHTSLRLAQQGSLRYLPSRYLINISYAAVFALKSSYSGAVVETDRQRIQELVDNVCAGLVLACLEKDHPAVQYGQMLRMLSKKLEELHDTNAVPSCFPSPEPNRGHDSETDSTQARAEQPAAFAWSIPTSFQENNTPPSTLQLPPFPGMSFFSNGALNPDYVAGGHHRVFDYGDTNFDFDLKGFWDDFTLGEGSGFPFK
nr:specific RNA polymerase II transcription factor [Cryptococcus depauperatus CBS 7855]